MGNALGFCGFFMKRIVLILTLFPLCSLASETSLAENMPGLPEDFRQYFYNSEMIVQVFLNDAALFDATISLKENGEVVLLRTIEESEDIAPDVRAQWASLLQKGVSLGKCTETCPSGLMAVEYRLDNSALKLYTSQYETSRANSVFISMPEETPGGVIMNNSVSATETSSLRSWGINSSLVSSFAGWSQKASFQSSGTDGYYQYSRSSLYELFTQKEYQGSFLRLGLFTPDNDTGDVQNSGFGYETVAGAMWGTSDALRIETDSTSAWPVYITGRNQSIAEVWRDDRLIYTQQLQAGIQALDTRQLPTGIYDITIKIIENGQTVDTQQSQIYKTTGWSNPDKRWRMNFWGGKPNTMAIGDAPERKNAPYSVGGGIDLLAHPRAIVGVSGASTDKEQRGRVRASITLSSNDALFTQYTRAKTVSQASEDMDIRYYRNIAGGGSASLFWRSTTTDVYGRKTFKRQRGDTWGGSLSLRLPHSTSLIANGQYMNTAWRKGMGADLSITTLATLAGRDMNLKLSAYDRPGFKDNGRDRGISLGINISLTPSARHTVSAETGVTQNQGYSSLNYQWQPDDSSRIKTLGGGVSYSPNNTTVNGNASVDTPYLSGDVYVQQGVQGRTRTAGGNLSQVLVIGGGRVASVNANDNRSMESALIVDVDADSDDATVLASGNIAEMRLKAGRNIVPSELWKKNTIQFTATGGDSIQVFPESQSVQMNRGSVQYLKVKAVKTYTLVSMLHNERGEVLKNRHVRSDVSDGVINAEGVLTLDVGSANRRLTVRAGEGQPEMQCALPSGMDPNKTFQFISTVKCRTVNAGAK